MKKIILLTVVAFCVMEVNAATTFTVDGYKYTVISEDEATVEFGTNAMYGDVKTNVVVPATVEYGGKTYTVIGIGRNAFATTRERTAKLLTVEMPNTIKYIGAHAFEHCSALQNFQFPQNLETIGERAFDYALNIFGGTVVLPESVRELRTRALNQGSNDLRNLAIKKLVVGKNVESIGADAAYVDTLIYNAINVASHGSETGDYGALFTVKNCLVLGEDVCVIPQGFVLLNGYYYSDLIIPDNVKCIKKFTFKSSSSSVKINNLIFGESLRIIEPEAFFCLNPPTLKGTITCKSKYPPVVYEAETAETPSFPKSTVFDNCSLVVPVGTEKSYQLADFWRRFILNMEEDEELGDYSDSQISSESFSFAQNGSVIETQSATILPLSIRNKYPVSAIEFDMEIPTNIELCSPSLTTTERTEGASVNTSQGSDGMIHVTIQPNGTIAAGKGAILNLNINAGKAGDYEIKLKNVKLTTGQEITLDDSELQFVANHKKGDYNEDGDVNVVDAQSLLNYVLGI